MADPVWLAPEILDGSPYDEAVDVYALGVIMWELLTRKQPFVEFGYEFSYQLEDAIRKGARPSLPICEGGPRSLVHVEFAALLQRCWIRNPLERPRSKEVAELLSKHLDLLDAL